MTPLARHAVKTTVRCPSRIHLWCAPYIAGRQLSGRLRATLPIAPLLDGSLSVGLSISHTYVPYGRIGLAELQGNLVSAALLLGIEG